MTKDLNIGFLVLNLGTVVVMGEESPFFRPLMRRLEDFYCMKSFGWEWEASKVRTRLKSDAG